MITKIHIQDKATIKNLIIEPYQINYVFGGNGTGKTTISNFLMDKNNYSNGNIALSEDCEVLIYNKAFVETNFQDKNAIHGIFTIGESAVEAVSFIEEQESKRQQIETKVKGYDQRINTLQTEISNLEKDFENNCWEIQKQLGDEFSKALIGFRRSKRDFAKKCKDSYESTLFDCSIEELRDTYNQIFQKEVQEYPIISLIDIDFSVFEKDNVFVQSIVKSSNSNFSKFFEALNNIDWVSQGLKYIKNSKICPFCQQPIPSTTLTNLSDLFDETYEQSIKQIQDIKTNYLNLEKQIKSRFEGINEFISTIPFISSDNLLKQQNELIMILDKNLSLMSEKIMHPASSIEFSISSELLSKINEELTKMNKLIFDNNILAKNLTQAKNDFSEKLWKFIANNKLYSVIENFKTQIDGKNKGLVKLLGFKKIAEDDINAISDAITEKRKGIANIDNVINEINSLLLGFGFNGFKIEKKDDVSYKLIRADGSEVKETLSEGEHRFISFLYFYHLVNGTLNREASIKNKIIIIDDPISSLDSNILFIVSYLVRELVSRCLKDSNVKQIFILTHNIYFHQEVAFKDRRNNVSKTKERFWILRKINEETKIESYDENQIKSSYELLWQEFKNPNTDSALICNTMRRILEHYFNVIGHLDYNKIIDSFTGQDKLICKSLLPFINTGSHFINDDFHISIDKDMVDKYKEIFRLIFEKTHQIAHYNMMMGIEE